MAGQWGTIFSLALGSQDATLAHSGHVLPPALLAHTHSQPHPSSSALYGFFPQAHSSPQKEVALHLTDKGLGAVRSISLNVLSCELFPLTYLMGRYCLEWQNLDPPQPASSPQTLSHEDSGFESDLSHP